MKRLILMALVGSLLMSGCGKPAASNVEEPDAAVPQETNEIDETPVQDDISDENEVAQSESTLATLEYKKIIPDFYGLDDSNLIRYVEDDVYSEVVAGLDDDNYFVENVSAVYVSQEYLEELAFNSQSNVFFGYSLSDLDAEFSGTRYVFTLGDSGETVVQAFNAYDDTYEKVIKNVAVGTGVILICVTVTAVTAGAGAPAVSMIFAAAAKSGTTFAASSGALGFVSASIAKGIETGDIESALKAGALAGSEGFKWGAITGVVTGGVTEGAKYTKAMKALKGATLNGITMQEAAKMQMESGYPVEIIKQFHSVEEYNVYREAGLTAKMINGELSLVRDIDLGFKSELPNGEMVSNLERMARGYAPIDPLTGKAYQLHHLGQKAHATLAVLTEAEHQGKSAILNILGKESEIDRAAFETARKAFWKAFAACVG